MPEIIEEQINLPEWPDLEEFMLFSQQHRIDGAEMKKLLEFWSSWLKTLRVVRIVDGKKSWLAVWLPAEIEQELDEMWANSPSQGFLAGNLAQFLCMSAVRELLPPIEGTGCAPAPDPVPALKQGLCDAGLEVDPDTGILRRRFAIVTWHPFKGGCEVCSLRENCPKGSGSGNESFSMVLNGHEKGKDD